MQFASRKWLLQKASERGDNFGGGAASAAALGELINQAQGGQSLRGNYPTESASCAAISAPRALLTAAERVVVETRRRGR